MKRKPHYRAEISNDDIIPVIYYNGEFIIGRSNVNIFKKTNPLVEVKDINNEIDYEVVRYKTDVYSYILKVLFQKIFNINKWWLLIPLKKDCLKLFGIRSTYHPACVHFKNILNEYKRTISNQQSGIVHHLEYNDDQLSKTNSGFSITTILK